VVASFLIISEGGTKPEPISQNEYHIQSYADV